MKKRKEIDAFILGQLAGSLSVCLAGVALLGAVVMCNRNRANSECVDSVAPIQKLSTTHAATQQIVVDSLVRGR